jgi:phage tail-like protein
MANTGFIVNTHRFDPYKNFKFRLIWDNKVVLGVSKASALKRTTEVVKHRSGGENSIDHKSPGRTSYEGLTLERGITHDPLMDLAGYKKELTLEVMNEKGQVAKRYFLHACWVSEYTAMPDLDANANAVAIENIKIELEGWERDVDTTEPSEAG